MFVAFEGIEGSGKTTLIARLGAWLEAKGMNPVITREPGEGFLGRRLRALLLEPARPPICADAELFLFLADRAQHLRDVILPALREGRPVLCDRFTDSTLAYQGGGRGMDMNLLKTLCHAASGGLAPDRVVLLDLPVSLGLERAARRNEAARNAREARFDQEARDFHERVRKAYLDLAARNDAMIVIDASQGPDEVFSRCAGALGLD